jgi:hypothetical protein
VVALRQVVVGADATGSEPSSAETPVEGNGCLETAGGAIATDHVPAIGGTATLTVCGCCPYLEDMKTVDWWELGRLVRVDRWLFDSDEAGHDWLVAIEFVFEKGAIVVEAVPDDDTVSVHVATDALTYWEGESVRVTADHAAIGMGVRWAWSLTNQQGYVDGFQVELTSDRERVRLQFVTVASRLVIFDVLEQAGVRWQGRTE